MKVNFPFFSFRFGLLAASLFIGFVGCDKSKPPCEGNFDEGAFIICEGQFLAGNGSVDWFDDEETSSCLDLFASQNAGAALGDVVQSATLHDGKIYVVVNNSNKIVVVDAETFEFQTEIKGFELPRFMKIVGSKGYVSQWGTDGLTGSVAVVDLATNKISSKITGLPNGPERMEVFGDRLIVGSSGGFDKDSSIAVIDFSKNTLEKTVKVGQNPASLAVVDGQLFVLCQGFLNFSTFTYEQSYLVEMRGDFTIKNLLLGGNGAISLVSDSNGVLFWNDPTAQSVLKLSKGGIQPERFYTKPNSRLYGLNVSETGVVWLLDARDNSSLGECQLINSDGTLKSTFSTSPNPNSIIFK